MNKEEIALELTKEFKNLIPVKTSEDNAKIVANFYNTIYDSIKTEKSERHIPQIKN